MRKARILAIACTTATLLSATPEVGMAYADEGFVPFTEDAINVQVPDEKRHHTGGTLTPEGEVLLISGAIVDGVDDPSVGPVNTDTEGSPDAPQIDSQAVAQRASAQEGSSPYMGTEDPSDLEGGEDEWNKQMERISQLLDDIDSQQQLNREQQIAADLLYRQQNPQPQGQVTIQDNVVYPPSVPGGEVTTATVQAPQGSQGGIALPPDASRAEKLIAILETQLGVPYLWGGTSPGVGLDCSGLVQWGYSQIGIDLPRTTWDQINQGTPVNNQGDLQPGDLVFPHAGHVGVYVGNGQMIHAPQPGEVVKIGPVYSFMKGVRLL